LARLFLRSILLITFLLACLAPCAAQKRRRAKARTATPPPAPRVLEETPQAWKEFAPPEGRFSILMPGNPVPDTSSGNEGVHDFSLTTSMAIYGAGYADWPKSEKDGAEYTKHVLDSTTQEMISVANTTLVSQTDILLKGHPGRELRLRLPEDGIYVDRMYIVGERLYQLSIAIQGYYARPEKKGFYDWTIAKYFESFTLISEK
jgi:hypothetical protein